MCSSIRLLTGRIVRIVRFDLSFSHLNLVKLYTLYFLQKQANYDRKVALLAAVSSQINYSAKLLNLNEWYYGVVKAMQLKQIMYAGAGLLMAMNYDASLTSHLHSRMAWRRRQCIDNLQRIFVIFVGNVRF